MRTISDGALSLIILSAMLQMFCFPMSSPIGLLQAGLCWIALVPLLVGLLRNDKTDAAIHPLGGAGLGYVCGFLWYLGNCSWIYQTMYLYGGMAKPVALLILVLFALYLGLYHALFGWLITMIRRSRLGTAGALLVTPFAWVAVELLRTRLTGFPWDLLGNAMVENSLLTQLAPVAGVMAISFLVAGVNAALAGCFVLEGAWRWRVGVTALVLAGLLQVGGIARVRGERTVGGTAVMVQENISVGATARGNRRLSPGEEMLQFSWLSGHPIPAGGASSELQPMIILWPEAPSNLHSDDRETREGLARLAREMHVPVIAGGLGIDVNAAVDRGYSLYDSAMVFDSDGAYEGRYDKIHLVPWGEYVPYKQLFGFASKLTEGSGDMDAGKRRSIFRLGGHTYGVFICYESIFGDEVKEFVRNGAEVLVNLSDDGWYGDTGAPWQHLNMARMRAIENHRWVLRATNTGETTSIDPWGNYVATPRHVRTAYALPFGFESRMTFYTRYGDWFAYVCGLVTITALATGWGRWNRRTTE